MPRAWCKVSVSLDSHPRIRKAGNLGRQVFEFALRRNAELDRGGVIPVHHLDAEYLADVLMLDDESAARTGLERCVRAGLLALTDDGYAICGWDDDWAKYPMTNAERQRLFRVRHQQSEQPTSQVVTDSNDASVTSNGSNGSDQIRGDQRREEEEKRESARAPARTRDHALQEPVTYTTASNCSDVPDVTTSALLTVTRNEASRPPFLSTSYSQTQERHIASGKTDWHRRLAIWNTFLAADERVRKSGVEPNGMSPPANLAGQNESNLTSCIRQISDSFGPGEVDGKMAHVIAVYEEEAIGKRTRKWMRAAVVFNPKTILDKASTPIGYWRHLNGHGSRAADAIEAQLDRVRQLEAEEAAS